MGVIRSVIVEKMVGKESDCPAGCQRDDRRAGFSPYSMLKRVILLTRSGGDFHKDILPRVESHDRQT